MLRTAIAVPEAIVTWLLTEKLLALDARATGPVYAETSHLLCKGFIEPLLELGIKPVFIILSRPAPEVARSLFQMDVIPGRTVAGKLVLLSPADPGVLSLPNWENYSDYQLCYWYAREIERRQAYYAALFERIGIDFRRVTMAELLDWSKFKALSFFVTGSSEPDRSAYDEVISQHQNPRGKLTGRSDRQLTDYPEAEEMLVDEALGLTVE